MNSSAAGTKERMCAFSISVALAKGKTINNGRLLTGSITVNIIIIDNQYFDRYLRLLQRVTFEWRCDVWYDYRAKTPPLVSVSIILYHSYIL